MLCWSINTKFMGGNAALIKVYTGRVSAGWLSVGAEEGTSAGVTRPFHLNVIEFANNNL
jgi:hypothetical protein